jgi:hypothetical protein
LPLPARAASGDGAIHGEGNAETGGDKRIDFKLKWTSFRGARLVA